MVRNILDASSYKQGEKALDLLAAHAYGKRLAHFLNPLLDAALMHLMACHQGLLRVSPEWLWRDFRQRLSRGRNHGSEQRLEPACGRQAGRAAVGHISQLHPRSEKVRTQTTLSTSRPEPSRGGWLTTGNKQLS